MNWDQAEPKGTREEWLRMSTWILETNTSDIRPVRSRRFFPPSEARQDRTTLRRAMVLIHDLTARGYLEMSASASAEGILGVTRAVVCRNLKEGIEQDALLFDMEIL